jgi:hypothetical protein
MMPPQGSVGQVPPGRELAAFDDERKPKYPCLNQWKGNNERVCNGPVDLSVIG